MRSLPHSAMTRHPSIRRLVILLLCGACVPVDCVREKPAAPVRPTPAAAARTQTPLHDLAGKPRIARRGITPGALEAEDSPPKNKSAEPSK